MGCDIHLFVEKKQKDNTWKQIDESFYDSRNYNLFAILANVRNGRGFAGCKTGEGFNPIADPKGVPTDASINYKSEVDKWDCDGHSHSYFTLQELLEYDWTQETIECGIVAFAAYFEWKWSEYYQDVHPKSWCRGISGRETKTIEESEAMKIVEELRKLQDYQKAQEKIASEYGSGFTSKLYVNASWHIKYYQCCLEFLGETIPRVLKLSEGDYSSVRIVFFFDN